MVKRPGIHDIAREANVSITTVSHALNGKGRVSPQMRERIRLVAQRLDYRGSPQARGLAMGRTMTLAMQLGSEAGVLVPGLEYFVEILTAASASALELGYGFVLAPTGTNAKSLQSLAIDGAVVVDPTGDEALFEDASIPIVTTGRVPGDLGNYSWVDNDHRAGTRLVLDHFTEIGCSRPALLATSVQQSYVEDAVAEYLDWCREHTLEPIMERVADSTTETDALSTIDKLLSHHPRPDAIYTTLDRLAVNVLLACHDKRISVPYDLAIASTTDTQFLRSANPPVTAFDLNAPEIGRKATELLIRQIEEDDEPSRHMIVPSSLTARASTRKTWSKDGSRESDSGGENRSE